MNPTLPSGSTRRPAHRRLLVALAALALLVVALPGAAIAQEEEGTVTVVHGVPDLAVDVYVNGDLTLEDFEFGTITDPLTLPAGDYDLEIRAAGEDADAEPAIAGSTSLPAGANASVVAHLDADGDPTLSVFVNDTDEIDAGDARLTVRHTAAAPTVDVLADGEPLVEGLSNPDEATAAVPAGSYEAAVALEGTTDPVIGPADLALDEGTGYFVYAVGSADDGNLDLLVQTVSGLHGNPDSVPAGSGGLADTTLPTWMLALSVAAGVSALAAGARLAYARR